MKHNRIKPPEPGDPFCCCGDADACCFDCDQVDNAFSRIFKRDFKNLDFLSRFVFSVCEHTGLPCCALRPIQVEFSVLPPMLLIPVLLRVAALHWLMGVVVLTSLPGLVLWYYYITHRKKRRTLFFLSLALFSLAYMYYLFLTEILPRGDVDNLQLVTVTTGMILTLVSLVRTKMGPGFVQPRLPNSATNSDSRFQNRYFDHCIKTSQSQTAVEQGGEKWRWCPACRLVRPPRAGHCRICGACVLRMDHHCVWINSCVGQANHKHFLLTLLLFLLTSLYGINLVLHSVCPQQSSLTALLYCPGVYNQYSTALCFTCVWYSSIVAGGLLHLLLLQLMNISYNVTEREIQIALRNGTARRWFCGLVIDTGVYSRGFYQNWAQFLTMDTMENISPVTLTHMV
ncbi:palmitoyltransferase ZDHHC23-A [Chanos chanos]|uniref:Palmitoyltransferase n=1 Tax=Chanos chanos TaxID=29144 RepID=A0A6J2WXC6_CHACN|nr:palmitoyltransferase ZDHHC23-like [Chanos chanos]